MENHVLKYDKFQKNLETKTFRFIIETLEEELKVSQENGDIADLKGEEQKYALEIAGHLLETQASYIKLLESLTQKIV